MTDQNHSSDNHSSMDDYKHGVSFSNQDVESIPTVTNLPNCKESVEMPEKQFFNKSFEISKSNVDQIGK